jgi:hypothetical protein
MSHELVTTEDNGLAVIEATARTVFDAACYNAQATWHNQNERLHRDFQDAIEDNAAVYRKALTQAQRDYRNATADVYELLECPYGVAARRSGRPLWGRVV